ncbi:MAG: zinc-dependent metalloprotease [Melioribacteraceae bacterium]|nr:zinc-dependent metalloprotease [Melioribacteraceae bacterium]
MKIYLVTLLTFLLYINPTAQEQQKDILSDTQQFQGFFNFHYSESEGKIYLEVDKLDYEFLYVNSLPNGIGSNDIGLDRGQLGNQRIVKFEKHGSKLLLIEPNYTYRASSENPSERKAVEQSFAKSVIWGFEILQTKDNKFVIDFTDFLMHDGKNVSGVLKRSNQGNYSVDKSKSAIYLENCKNFPKNSEFEVIQTFTGEPKGGWIRSVTPTPTNITVHQRHSFVMLPDDNYTPRKFDSRAGYFPLTFYDYSTPISESTEIKYIYRHRLKKQNPSAEKSEAVNPIIYYVDNGVPEPVLSALIEGATWWNQAFEAAGFINAFQVKVLPEGADPMDVRYNVIQWVHRSTRGWSYGGSVADPRTGEVIKGHISLGSLRVRQDYLIAQGLLAAYKSGENIPSELEEMALARIRQLSAHEVGHALGLAHNFAASAKNRASVMDYPHPFVELKENGEMDFSKAYDTGIGDWDKIAIRYGYSEFNSDEEAELQKIIDDYIENDFVFITDYDARATGGAHPFAHLWDNGTSPIEELERILKLRKFALENFSADNIPDNEPYSKLEDMLVPLYYSFRYQAEAVVKLVGGLDYRYAYKNDGQLIQKYVEPKIQSDALKSLLKTVSTEQLIIPKHILDLLPPRSFGNYRNNESFDSNTGVTFDPITAAVSVSDFVFPLILNPERASRLVVQNALDNSNPSLESVIESVFASSIKSKGKEGLARQIQSGIDESVINSLMLLANDNKTLASVREISFGKLNEIKNWMENELKTLKVYEQKNHFSYLINRIESYLDDPGEYQIQLESELPPGSPIGSEQKCYFGY